MCVVIAHPGDVWITEYEVSNWETFWFQWLFNSSTPGYECSYDGWFRNRYSEICVWNVCELVMMMLYYIYYIKRILCSHVY